MSHEIAGQFAEILVSPAFTEARNTAFEESPNSYHEQQALAETIAINALWEHASDPQYGIWEMRRRTAILTTTGTELGAYEEALQRQGGLAPIASKTAAELGKGENEVVRTNSQVVGLRDVIEDPIDYLDAALSTIDARHNSVTGRTIGPENYATALKLFTDKYLSFPSEHLDPKAIQEQVEKCMDGFFKIAKSDRPNFLEMTNVYFAIRHLPAKSFDKKFTNTLLRYSLELLPEYGNDSGQGNGTLSIMVACMRKLDLSESGETAGNLVDLALRKGKSFSTGNDYLQTLATIGNLPQNGAANRCFASFLACRNNLETVLDIEGCDVANEQLLQIVDKVIDDPRLSQHAKTLSQQIAMRAANIYNYQKRMGTLTENRLAQLRQTVINITNNSSSI